VRNLGLEDAEVVVTGFDRPNLELSVHEARSANKKHEAASALLGKWLADGGSSIVYAATRKRTEEIADALRAFGWKAEAYHAGMMADARTRVQQRFEQGLVQVVVATSAFGMGVDKADVRVVIHHDVPQSPEAYYQEVGPRGGVTATQRRACSCTTPATCGLRTCASSPRAPRRRRWSVRRAAGGPGRALGCGRGNARRDRPAPRARRRAVGARGHRGARAPGPRDAAAGSARDVRTGVGPSSARPSITARGWSAASSMR
jgi:ATP-dependent DNA helicase RecQ